MGGPPGGAPSRPDFLVEATLYNGRLRAMPTHSSPIEKRRLGVAERRHVHLRHSASSPTLRGSRVARGQQPRPGEQLLAQRCRAGSRACRRPLLQDGHDQVDKVFETLRAIRLRLKPSISVFSTQAIRSSATSSAEPTAAEFNNTTRGYISVRLSPTYLLPYPDWGCAEPARSAPMALTMKANRARLGSAISVPSCVPRCTAWER